MKKQASKEKMVSNPLNRFERMVDKTRTMKNCKCLLRAAKDSCGEPWSATF